MLIPKISCTNACVLISLICFVVGCTNSVPEIDSLRFIETREESDGLRNQMSVYAVEGTFDSGEFHELCIAVKSNATAEALTYIVVFDDPANATFPNSPYTAMYGLEEEKMRHIIAIFEYNRANGFCQSRIYEPNMWEGKPVVTKF